VQNLPIEPFQVLVEFSFIFFQNLEVLVDLWTNSRMASAGTQTRRSSWMKDHESLRCLDCKKEFSLFKRRHHCRMCGKLFCYKCTQFRKTFPGKDRSSRVCRDCYNQPRNNHSELPQFTVIGLNVIRDCESPTLQPARTWKAAVDNNFQGVEFSDIFAGKRVAVFHLPGPFTNSCSNQHIPNIKSNYQALKDHGVTDVILLSMCDPYALHEWAMSLDIEGVQWFTDIHGGLAKFLRTEMDLTFALLPGKRSNRYAMFVDDGIIYWFSQEDGHTDVIKTKAECLLSYLQTPKYPMLEKARTPPVYPLSSDSQDVLYRFETL